MTDESVDPAEAAVAQMMRDGGQLWPSEIVATVRGEADRIREERNRYFKALLELRLLLGNGWEGTGTEALEKVVDDALADPPQDFATPVGDGMKRPDEATQADLRAQHRALQDDIAPQIEANERARRMPGVIGG